MANSERIKHLSPKALLHDTSQHRAWGQSHVVSIFLPLKQSQLLKLVAFPFSRPLAPLTPFRLPAFSSLGPWGAPGAPAAASYLTPAQLPLAPLPFSVEGLSPQVFSDISVLVFHSPRLACMAQIPACQREVFCPFGVARGTGHPCQRVWVSAPLGSPAPRVTIPRAGSTYESLRA